MRRLNWTEVASRAAGPLTPGRAGTLVGALGGLAPYWLTDATLAVWNEEFPQAAFALPWRPRLPDTPGSCWVVFAVDGPEAYPLLRPALLLPLCWARGEVHGPGLPPKLLTVAEGVIRSTGVSGWGLRLAPLGEVDRLDLSGLDFDADSAWAPLAGGLLVAIDGGRPRPDVWATGCWARYGGVAAVGGLSAKRQLAHCWGANLFFVPPGQVEAAATAPELRPLSSNLAPREALRDYLAALDAPPPADAPFAEQSAYYLRQPVEATDAAVFYRRRLLPEVTNRLAARLRQEEADCRPTSLVTVVSGSPELVLLAVGALGPRRCLLLHTDTFTPLAAEVAGLLREGGYEAVPARFDAHAGLTTDMTERVRSFLEATDAAAVAFDLTPGTKLMTLTLEALARRQWPGSWLLYLRHELRGRRAIPGSEELVLWRAG